MNTGITTGYDGKGTFYVFSAGNGHLLGDDSNFDEYVNSLWRDRRLLREQRRRQGRLLGNGRQPVGLRPLE